MKFLLKIATLAMLASFFTVPMQAQTSFSSNRYNELNYTSQEGNDVSKKKKKDEFKVSAALSFNNLNVQSEYYETTTGLGWMVGGSYKRGRILYWEVGARYNRAVYDLANAGDTSGYTDRLFAVSNIDVPITFGVNVLWFASRILGARIFISAVPQFVIGINDNDLDITKDDLNTFNFCGQGGIGVDVLFLSVETGIQYGINDLLKDSSPSNPVQVFVSLGFRF